MNRILFVYALFVMIFIFSTVSHSATIKNIIIQSDTGTTLDYLLPLTGLSEGMSVNNNQLRSSVKNLFRFKNIKQIKLYEANDNDNISLAYELSFYKTIQNITINGRSKISESLLLEQTDLSLGFVFHETRLNDYKNIIVKNYHDNGFGNVQVSIVPKDEANGLDMSLAIHVTEGNPFKIGRIHFEERPHIFTTDYRMILSSEKGSAYNRQKILSLIDKTKVYLQKNGYTNCDIAFADEIFHSQSETVDITIKVNLGKRLDFQFSGNTVFSSKKLSDFLHQSSHNIFSFIYMKEQILELYYRYGFSMAQVEYEQTVADNTDTTYIYFRINEGKQLFVKKIQFIGSQHFSNDYLHDVFLKHYRSLMEKSASSLLFGIKDSWFSFSDDRENSQSLLSEIPAEWTYSRHGYKETLKKLENLYKKDGFLHIEFRKEKYMILNDNTMNIQIPVIEKNQSIIKTISAHGINHQWYSLLLKDLPLRAPSELNYEMIEKSKKILLDRLKNQGFLDAQIEYKIVPLIHNDNKENNTSWYELHFYLHPGKKIQVQTITIIGNTLTHESVVYNSLTFTINSTVTQSQIDTSYHDLFNLNLFNDIDIQRYPDLIHNEKNHLYVFLREQKPQSIEIGGGLGTEEGIRSSIKYEHANIGGHDIKLSARATANYKLFFFLYGEPLASAAYDRFIVLPLADRIEREIGLGLNYPRVYGFSKNTSLFGDIVNLRNNALFYSEEESKLILGLSHRITPPINITVQNNVELSNLQCFEAYHTTTYSFREGCGWLTTVRNKLESGSYVYDIMSSSLSFDFRNDRFFPSKGLFLSFSWQKAFSLNSAGADYDKLEGMTNFYFPVIGPLQMALSLKSGKIITSPNDNASVPRNRRFFLGGRSTVRGYIEDAILPEDMTDLVENLQNNSFIIGGKLYHLAKTELRLALHSNFSTALFFDAGTLWNESALFVTDPQHFRYSAGTGIRYHTPVGPISLDLGIPLNRANPSFQSSYNIHFNFQVF